MNERQNQLHQNLSPENSQEKIEQAKKNVTWQVVEALNASGKEVIEAKKSTEIKETSEKLDDLKNSVPKTPKINWESYNTSHNHKRIEQELANTSTGEFLRGIHEELRERNIGSQYLHLLEKRDSYFG